MKIPALVLNACALLCLTGAAAADPVTYAGTLGKAKIVVEFTSDPAGGDPAGGGAIGGRYFYRAKGADIPLQPRANAAGAITLAEEGPCDQPACLEGGPAPVAATWSLKATGKALRGTWKSGKKALPVALDRVAGRPAPEDGPAGPLGLFQFSDNLAYAVNDGPIPKGTSPYDRLRFDAPMEEGDAEGWSDAPFRYVVDPRTKFRVPRLAGASDSPANRLLQGRQERTGLMALDCLSQGYAGFIEGEGPRSGGGSLGGFEDIQLDVTFLSLRLMSWTEGGSTFCGGASPNNFADSFNLDVARGTMLMPKDLFGGWTDEGPSAKLADFVRKRRPRPTDEGDIAAEKECGTDDLIKEYLGAHFRRDASGESVVFTLEGLPHAIVACGGDLLALPVREVLPLMTPAGRALLAGTSAKGG